MAAQAALAALHIADPPDVWSELGFEVEDESVKVSGARLLLGAEGKGLRSWSLRGVPPDTSGVDGLDFGLPAFPPRPTPEHANGVTELDHLVVLTPDIGRTIASFEAIGTEVRRVRDTGTASAPMQQAFFRLGEVILEVVGPKEASGDGPLRLYGLAWTVRDLDETTAYLGDRLRPAKDAVQPGRRIATLDRAAGSTVPQAFMSPEP